MIRIERQPGPEIFSSPQVRKEYSLAKDFYQGHVKTRSQRRFQFKSLANREVKKALAVNFNNKCAFCESPLAAGSGDIEYFRPPGGALDLGKKLDPDHYWWLYYEWRNYYLSCEICNRGKKDRFPVDGARIPLMTPYDELLREKNLLLDPCIDDPEKHIKFNDRGFALALSRKGETTIEIYSLNRIKLVELRRRMYLELAELLKKLGAGIKKFNAFPGIQLKHTVAKRETPGLARIQALMAPTKPFLGLKKAMLLEWVRSRPGLIYEDLLFQSFDYIASSLKEGLAKKVIKRSIAPPAKNVISSVQEAQHKYASKALLAIKDEKLFLERIEIKNFKSIEALTLNFPAYDVVQDLEQSSKTTHDRYEPWLMLLGENGVGKSSFLQAMALTLMGKKYLSAMRVKATNILKHGKSSGFVKIYHEQSKEPITINFSRTGKVTSNYESPTAYLLAYGSTRLFPTVLLKEESGSGKIKVKNMFRPDVALADSRKFILDIYKKSRIRSRQNEKFIELFDSMGLAIKDLLLLKGNESLRVFRGEVYIDYGNGKRDTLRELSDGYKSIIALAIDIIKTLWKVNAVFATAQGIVLLDEIGTHLHPRWRMQVVKKMRNAFPGLQFIVTTHDPLCLRGLKKGEVVVFDKDEDNRVFVIDDLPDSSEYRVDQLLTSPFFGLNSVVDPELEKEFNDYYLLLRKAQPTKEEQGEIIRLRDKLQPRLHLGGSFREELIYKAVDQVIANSNIRTPKQFLVGSTQNNSEKTTAAPVNKSASKERAKAEAEVKVKIRQLLKKK